ncbi:MAG: hypothetical protein IJS19_06500 [Muribaculaceae bacterium]|nr:hypothetical protein [Muribaculaceae bacterium]
MKASLGEHLNDLGKAREGAIFEWNLVPPFKGTEDDLKRIVSESLPEGLDFNVFYAITANDNEFISYVTFQVANIVR